MGKPMSEDRLIPRTVHFHSKDLDYLVQWAKNDQINLNELIRQITHDRIEQHKTNSK